MRVVLVCFWCRSFVLEDCWLPLFIVKLLCLFQAINLYHWTPPSRHPSPLPNPRFVLFPVRRPQPLFPSPITIPLPGFGDGRRGSEDLSSRFLWLRFFFFGYIGLVLVIWVGRWVFQYLIWVDFIWYYLKFLVSFSFLQFGWITLTREARKNRRARWKDPVGGRSDFSSLTFGRLIMVY